MMVTTNEKGVDSQSYVVYVDRVDRTARVHRLACRHVYINGGVSRVPNPTTCYIGFFDRREGARSMAARLGLANIRDCRGCG